LQNTAAADGSGMSRRHKITLLAALYVAQGLPYGFFTQALPVLLRDAGYSLKAISATSLLFLPWALKFLWAPFVDQRGTRKSWLLPLQAAAVVFSVLLAGIEPGDGYVLLLAAGLGGIALLWAGTVAEHLLGSMATVALFTLMMDASDPEHAGTDYTLLACAVVVAMGLASFTGATIADAAGYVTSFGAGFALSLAGCLVLVLALDSRRGPARLQPVWSTP
jgi:MFS family permease